MSRITIEDLMQLHGIDKKDNQMSDEEFSHAIKSFSSDLIDRVYNGFNLQKDQHLITITEVETEVNRLADVVPKEYLKRCAFLVSDLKGRLKEDPCYQNMPCVTTLPAPTPTKDDPVEHPSHYTSHPSGIECIEVTQHFNFNLGNVIKYVWRAGLKASATHLEDLRKALVYLKFEIKRLGGNDE